MKTFNSIVLLLAVHLFLNGQTHTTDVTINNASDSKTILNIESEFQSGINITTTSTTSANYINFKNGTGKFWQLTGPREPENPANFSIYFNDGSYHRYFMITNSGNVGIGTNNTEGYKLAVAGSVIAESVKIKLQAEWPDYVFSSGYKLPSLMETEKFIQQNGHLPGMPDAAEIQQEGVDLGEMNARLLQKLEEQTLYIIEMNKQLVELKKQLEEIKNK